MSSANIPTLTPTPISISDDAPYHFRSRIHRATLTSESHRLISDLCAHTADLSAQVTDLKRRLHDYEGDSGAGAANSKKRKLDGGGRGSDGVAQQQHTSSRGQDAAADAWQSGTPSFEAPDISVVVPVRKKFCLRVVDGRGGGVVLAAPVGREGEGGMAVRWEDVDQIISIPVPEASKASHYFVLLPTSTARAGGDAAAAEPIVFSVPDAKPKDGKDGDQDRETQDATLTRVLDGGLARFGKRVVQPEASEFASKLVQAHRKGEKAWHVKAFRGSKEGFLYLLRTGILFGFRKPVLFFPLHGITSVSYSSVLQRTFNLNVGARLSRSDVTCFLPGAPGTGAGAGEEMEADFEFSMLDQADYEGLNRYVQGHGLHDSSLAEGRRARWYNVNKDRNKNNGVKHEGDGDDAGAHAAEPEEESELMKAERELQDREDEQEEDYDPSGGESEGSGSESEEEEEGYGQNGDVGAEEGEEEDHEEL